MKTKRERELEQEIERLEARKRERALERRFCELQADEAIEAAKDSGPSDAVAEFLRRFAQQPTPVVVPIYVPMPAPVQVHPTWIPGDIICSVSDRTH